jgi:hypothetical protein
MSIIKLSPMSLDKTVTYLAPRGQLGRIARVGLGIAAVHRPHREGRAPPAGTTCGHTVLGEPRPGEETGNGDDQPRTRGGNGLEKGCRSRGPVAVPQDCPSMPQAADRPGAGMQVKPTGTLVLRGGEEPASPPLSWGRVVPSLSRPLG